MRTLVTLVVLLAFGGMSSLADDVPLGPKLLLNAQRLRRLKRDRERKTVRWVNFENRVNHVPDSPERGFELALYYAITGDEAKGREAVQWTYDHDSARQDSLVYDWCAPLIPSHEIKTPRALRGNSTQSMERMRDEWFQGIQLGREVKAPAEDPIKSALVQLVEGRLQNAQELYALCELIYAVRANTRKDLRETDAHFFANLPALLLLSAKPHELGAPDWRMHAAALALVAIDPNLPASQFLQSWALEDSQTLREGPGVAYELLWADPYLPGVGYQNMEPWIYDDDHAMLYARAGWESNSCWITISAKGVAQENCPPNWQSVTVMFGHLTLIPMTERCVDIPHLNNRNESIMVWKLRPGEKLTHGKGKEQRSSEADAAGIWRPGANVEGKVCLAPH